MPPSDTTSATGGYLAPDAGLAAPLGDLALDAFLGGVVAGITGLAGLHVLPRWQDVQPRLPDPGVNWCAIGVTASQPDDTPAQIFDPARGGSVTLRAFYRLDALASFYGPDGDGLARLLRDGLYLAQNREGLLRAGLTYLDCDPVRRVPEIIAAQTRRRSDLALRFGQCVTRRYPIHAVRELTGALIAQGDGPDPIGNALRTVPPAGA